MNIPSKNLLLSIAISALVTAPTAMADERYGKRGVSIPSVIVTVQNQAAQRGAVQTPVWAGRGGPRRLDDSTPAHSFRTLLKRLSTIVRNTCRTNSADTNAPTFELTTTADAQQQRALDLIDAIALVGRAAHPDF